MAADETEGVPARAVFVGARAARASGGEPWKDAVTTAAPRKRTRRAREVALKPGLKSDGTDGDVLAVMDSRITPLARGKGNRFWQH
jgi:hypothetical protein